MPQDLPTTAPWVILSDRPSVGESVCFLVAGKLDGPFTVTAHEGRSADHIVLSNPRNGGVFEHYFDAGFNTYGLES